MQVNKTGADALRVDPAATKPIAGPGTSAGTPIEAVVPVRRADEVEISDAARKLAEGEPVDMTLAELGSDRVSEIRARISSGAYLTTDVAALTAQGILRQGDLS